MADVTLKLVIDEQTEEILRTLARQKKRKVEDLVRDSILLLLKREGYLHDPAWDIIGLGEAPISDLGTHHDKHMISVLEAELLP